MAASFSSFVGVAAAAVAGEPAEPVWCVAEQAAAVRESVEVRASHYCDLNSWVAPVVEPRSAEEAVAAEVVAHAGCIADYELLGSLVRAVCVAYY